MFAPRRGRAFLVLFVAVLAVAPTVGWARVQASAASSSASTEDVAPTDWRGVQATDAEFNRLVLDSDGRAQVLVGLRALFVPEGNLSADAVTQQRQTFATASRELVAVTASTGTTVLRTYVSVPYVALVATRSGLDALRASGRAANVTQNAVLEPLLDTTTAVVEANETRALGRTGSGRTVVVLDTGVDKNHPFLQDPHYPSGPPSSKVVAEACFSTQTFSGGTQFTSMCPNNATFSSAPGSGMPCTNFAVCEHGTHVAGIAAGGEMLAYPVGTPPPGPVAGVAPGASLISIQVFTKITFNGVSQIGGSTADTVAALDYVNATLAPAHPLAAVNLSIGTLSPSICDNNLGKLSVDNLTSKKIAVIAASGNNGIKNTLINNGHIVWPACLPPVIAVGATDSADNVWSASNSNAEVDLLAPGVAVKSSVPGGGYATRGGTSMAAPHVAGAWAVLRAVDPSATVASLFSHLGTTGKDVSDAANGLHRPRIRVLAASVALADTGFKPGGGYTYTGGLVASAGVGLRPALTKTITIAGVPPGVSVKQAFLYWTTIGGPDATATFAGTTYAGGLVGASRNTCENINQFGPIRTYRAPLPLSAVSATANGSYSVGGIGGAAGVEAQGASLVVIYTDPNVSQTGRIVIRHGAKSVQPAFFPTMTDTFTPVVPSNVTQSFLHVGMAGGDAAPENPLLFDGTAVTMGSSFSGAAGPKWDHVARLVPLNPSLASHTVSITTGSNASGGLPGSCLAWAFSVLNYLW